MEGCRPTVFDIKTIEAEDYSSAQEYADELLSSEVNKILSKFPEFSTSTSFHVEVLRVY